MSDAIKIEAKTRKEEGSSAARRLRRNGVLPAIVYGAGNDPGMIALNEHDFEQLLRHHASENLVIDLAVDGDKVKKVLLKDVQHHPVSGQVLHADFQEISMTEMLRVNIALELTGTPSGVSQQGGVLEHLLREVEVECLPADIVEEIEVDVSALNIGDSLAVEDLPIDTSKYTVLTAADIAVAAVAAPRVSAAEEEEEAEGEAAEEGVGPAEPEVIKEKKEEDEG
jgi:large subunit ribosomal protein L25